MLKLNFQNAQISGFSACLRADSNGPNLRPYFIGKVKMNFSKYSPVTTNAITTKTISLAAFIALTSFMQNVFAQTTSTGVPMPQPIISFAEHKPIIGKWKARYSEAFAAKYNLPKENIGSLSPSVDYMEIDVIDNPVGLPRCMVNTLIKQTSNLDFSSATPPEKGDWIYAFNKERKLTHFVTQNPPTDLERVDTVFTSSSDFGMHAGFLDTAFAMASKSYLPGYYYVSADVSCEGLSLRMKQYSDQYELKIIKEGKINSVRNIPAKDIGRPENLAKFKSVLIPKDFISYIFF